MRIFILLIVVSKDKDSCTLASTGKVLEKRCFFVRESKPVFTVRSIVTPVL